VIYVAVALVALSALLIVLSARERKQFAVNMERLHDLHQEQIAAQAAERRELLNRLAQPGLVAIPPEQQVKPREPKDMSDFRKIGTVQPARKEPVDAA
jgi:hypothetical protein